MAQQILDLKEQFNTLKAETGKGTDVSVTLQLVRQLATASHHIRDPFAILGALQKLADEARVSGDPSASSDPSASRAIFIPMLGGISHSSPEPEVFLQGALEEAPERVVSVSIVASVVTFKKLYFFLSYC